MRLGRTPSGLRRPPCAGARVLLPLEHVEPVLANKIVRCRLERGWRPEARADLGKTVALEFAAQRPTRLHERVLG